ncbi:hypothetical protein I7I50_03126 [Histoplasma capsulatum G186AR]|uniref:Uncharacterized protein n=1 Tax=Ajellomyces capsulatus TaxID=5037 RepID=A0A8H7Z1I7_AJECA|nr:hypothetical protein I7I52_00205 [Histoplasma capsulatum]QSS72070.1 hypothetical protein I7I50_03126 [Histoplasma capsulatum G186AR]
MRHTLHQTPPTRLEDNDLEPPEKGYGPSGRSNVEKRTRVQVDLLGQVRQHSCDDNGVTQKVDNAQTINEAHDSTEKNRLSATGLTKLQGSW